MKNQNPYSSTLPFRYNPVPTGLPLCLSMGVQMEEIWKVVPGYEMFEASNLGRIRGYWNRNLIIKKQLLNKSGYWMIHYHPSGRPRMCSKFVFVHRMVALAFIPNPENKTQVNHKDKNRKNANVENLEWVTPQENHIHAILTGSFIGMNQGEKSPSAKLNDNQVLEIRVRRGNGEKLVDLAKEFNTTFQNIYRIYTRRSWSHI